MNRPTFDICLITRNEEKTLPHLLESLSEFKMRNGQVNVCDTGSQDNTVKIAKDWGCNVKEIGNKYVHTIDVNLAKKINDRFIIENEKQIVNAGDTYFDFASARNESTLMASNDWVSIVDGDEILTRFDIDAVENIIKDPTLGQLEYNFVFSHFPNGRELVKFVQSKFYNRKRMEWQGIIHEMVTPISGVNLPMDRQFLPESVFKLEHWQNPETNRTGYLRGLAVDCFEHQDKDRNSHYFSREMWWNGRPFSAAKEFIRHIKMDRWPAERAESLLFISDICGALAGMKKEEETRNENTR
jgi:glycosyltransferase involved in cell wall biosynthesis